MSYIFFILVFGFNIFLAFIDGYNFYACLSSFLFNTMTYPVFIMLLVGKTIVSKPLIDIKEGITADHNVREAVISRSKLVCKNSFLWFFLCCFPFVIYVLTHNDFIEQISVITIFIAINGILATVSLLILSTVLQLYYEKMFWALLSVSGLILTSFFAFVPQTELNLLFLFAVILVIACCSSFVLIHKRNKLKKCNLDKSEH